MKRRQRVSWVTDRTMHAYRAGQHCEPMFETVERAIVAVVQQTDRYLDDNERIAYAQLLPTTWWAHFRRGFFDARSGSRRV